MAAKTDRQKVVALFKELGIGFDELDTGDIGKDIANFAETLSSRHESNVQEQGSSSYLRQKTVEGSWLAIEELQNQLQYSLKQGNHVKAKVLALDIANEARNIWEKL